MDCDRCQHLRPSKPGIDLSSDIAVAGRTCETRGPCWAARSSRLFSCANGNLLRHCGIRELQRSCISISCNDVDEGLSSSLVARAVILYWSSHGLQSFWAGSPRSFLAPLDGLRLFPSRPVSMLSSLSSHIFTTYSPRNNPSHGREPGWFNRIAARPQPETQGVVATMSLSRYLLRIWSRK